MKRFSTTFLMLALAGCGGSSAEQAATAAAAPGHHPDLSNVHNLCDSTLPGREVSEYDTSGDEIPDVRKVYKQVGQAPMLRLVLICREADLNGDGVRDVVRNYNDEGRPLNETADRNFDHVMDTTTIFDRGLIAREEIDSNGDGKIDLKVFYENNVPIRSERDTKGRSTPNNWKPDVWEYFETGRLVRMGTDLDGDGVVDRWDRDEAARSHAALLVREDQGDNPDAGPKDAGTAPADAGAHAAAAHHHGHH